MCFFESLLRMNNLASRLPLPRWIYRDGSRDNLRCLLTMGMVGETSSLEPQIVLELDTEISIIEIFGLNELHTNIFL